MTTSHSTAPLAGLRVVDLSTFVAGPSAAMILAQLGADVVRVDPIGGAPDTRRLPLAPDGSSLYWAGLNRHKRSVTVDIRQPAGRDLVRAMIARPDDGGGILLTNAVGQDWLDYGTLSIDRPDLILVRIMGRADGSAAVDYTINAEIGLPWLTGPTDSTAPVNHVLPAWDLLTGVHAALAVVAAERQRRSTGAGQHIEISLSDMAVATMAHLGYVGDRVVNGRVRERDGNYLYGSYATDFGTADGARVMVVALTPRHWRQLVDVTGTRELMTAVETNLGADFAREDHRYEHRELITAILRPWFRDRTSESVGAALDTSGVLWGPYRRVEEICDGPGSPVALSPLFSEVDHPGVGTYPVPGPVARMSGWQPSVPASSSTVGGDSDQVLREWLGTDDAELDRLREAGVLGGLRARSGGAES